MPARLGAFLMFDDGRAADAMAFTVSLFPDGKVESLRRWSPGEAGPEGAIMHAAFGIAGQRLMCIDSPAKHAFGFTPSVSLFVECDGAVEVDRLFAALSPGGGAPMPLDAYPFAERFAWLNDRFGVSWQLRFT